MSFSDALRLLARHWLLLVLVPLVLGVSAFVFARRIPKVYNSDTTIYTGIASGYTLNGDAAADYNATNNAFDNLINLITARSTKIEVVYRLVAQHLWQLHQHPALGATPPYSSLQDALPAPLRQQLLGASEAATLDNVRRTATSNEDNPIVRLINSGDATYSLNALSHLTASRINISDLVKLEFESYDPEVCRRTLQLVTEAFMDQSRDLREGQTSSVIKYYEDELARNKAQMDKTENAILAFNRNNNIINYETQSTNTANNKDALAADMITLRQQYAGAQAALNAINGRLGHRESTLTSSRQMLEQRQKLNRLNAALTDAQLQDGNSAKVKQLQAEADRTAQAMQQNVDTYYAQSTSTDGIPSKDLMNEWVQDMVLVETNRAKLGVMEKRLGEFESEYQRMAPLGATIKKLERDNELAEKAYLATLASLNSSKASMQNTQLTSKVKIIDAPNMPTSPKNGKLLPIVGLSAVGGLVFVAGLVLGLGLLDKSLKTPAAAARQIGLPVAGIMLDAHTTPPKLLQASQQRSLDQLVRHILIQANTPPAAAPFVVGVFSVQHQESKTTLCQALAQRCHQMGISTLALYPDANGIAPDTQDPIETPSLYYSPEIAASRGWPLDELIQNAMPKHMQETSSPSIKVVLVEFPALRESLLPVGVLRELSLVFLTVPANRPWSQADQQTIERLRAATAAPVEVVLFGVAAHHEEMV
jgi:succinoglycan biosynthesis transport protein ExoP